jgi:spermidine synthase
MAGMALGAWRISRWASTHPAKLYGFLEIGIGLWGAFIAHVFPVFNSIALDYIGLNPSPLRQWVVSFVLPGLTLLPATIAMGATFPVIERLATPIVSSGKSASSLYGVNTLGAVFGILASAFIVLPQLGLRRASFVFAAINIVCGLVALLFSRIAAPREHVRSAAPAPRRLLITMFVTGLLAMGYEVVGVRVLSRVLEDTVYTFAVVLAIYLVGTSIGAFIYHRWGGRVPVADLLCLTALACATSVVLATQADDVYAALRTSMPAWTFAAIFAEMCVAATIFLLPTMAMGATFGCLAELAAETRLRLSPALALNLLGAALAPFLFSVALLPSLGSKWTWGVVAIGYVLAVPRLQGWRWITSVIVPVTFIFLPAHFNYIESPPGGRMTAYVEGTMASVAVVADAKGHKTLRVGNRFQMGGTAVADAEYRHAHIPLLLHPRPRTALFLGLGTGITLDGAGLHTNVIAHGVELLPEVVAVMSEFAPYNEAVRTNGNIEVFVADARRFVQVATNFYDVIVGDLFHPARDGAGALYTREHFQAVRSHLTPNGGLFCQWLPLYQLDVETLRVIIRTYRSVFGNTEAWLLRFNVDTPVVGLVGRTATTSYATNWLESRVESPLLMQRLQRLSLGDSLRLFGNLLAGPAELDAFARGARINTDDNSVVLFGAPEFTYRGEMKPHGTLLALLDVKLTNTAVLGFDSPQLGAFIRAQDVFIRGLVDESEGRIDAALAKYVETARISPNFTAGYARVITVATAEASANPAKARRLLEQLIEAQPSVPVAKQLLERLFPQL